MERIVKQETVALQKQLKDSATAVIRGLKEERAKQLQHGVGVEEEVETMMFSYRKVKHSFSLHP